jgi:hypothetical protein
MRRRLRALLALGLALGTALTASAAAVEVTTAADENNGSLDPGLGNGISLREAVLHAPAGSTLEFAPTLDGATVTLGLGQIVIGKDLVIDASALPSGVIVSGNDSSRVFDISSGRTVSMKRLKIIDGAITTVGGGIRNAGNLTLLDCELSSNRANDGGGAIRNSGTLVLNACTLEGNTAGVGGGAIEHGAGLLALTNCTLTGNSAQWGGAIDGDGTSTVRLYSCTVSGNHASDKGGGIEETTGTLLLENSIIAGNTATNSGPDLKASSINTQLGVNLLSSTNGLGGGFAGIVAAPNLSALGAFGGPTRTMPPQSGSPAIDAAGATALAVDQRGLPRVVGPKSDIGAVEVQGSLIVTTAANSGPGSLRDTVGLAAPGSTVLFAPALSGATITLTGGEILLDKNLTIDALALAEGVEITGAVTQVFEVVPGSRAVIKGLTIRDISGGGETDVAIFNGGDLELFRCVLSGNTGGGGGAIHNTGMLSMVDCTVAENEVVLEEGGGLLNDGEARLSGCLFRDNGSATSGGAISNRGLLEIDGCTFSSNSANFDGGGFYNDLSGSAYLENCSFSGNVAEGGGAFMNHGYAYVASTSFLNNEARGEGYGGGILNLMLGELELAGCTISGNESDIDGGGIYSDSYLLMRGCAVEGNSAATRGGGIHAGGSGYLLLKESTVMGNSCGGDGGGIFNNEGTIDLLDSAIMENECEHEGGGVSSRGRLLVKDSEFVGNGSYDTGGAIFSTGTLSMVRSTAEDNWAGDNGGALHTSSGAAELSACTLSGNLSYEGEGAGIYQGGGSLILTQCTITGNLADLGFGGGISSRGVIGVVSCTIADNTAFFEGGGMDLYPSAVLTLTNTIVAGNSAPAGPDISGAIFSQSGVNLLKSTSGVTVPFTGIVGDPLLSPLSGNGGPTRTMLPLPGSPAIDAGGPTILLVDQRGFIRVIGGRVDIGAVEAGAAMPGLVVDTIMDENDGPDVGNISLRDAINWSSAGSTIYFDPALDGQRILLTVGTLVVGKDLAIDASSLSSGIEVSGNGNYRVFDIQPARTVAMRSLGILFGRISSDGGGIRNAGNLTLNRCVVSGNRAGDDGGGIFNTGTLTLNSSQLGGNSAADGGGAIVSEGVLSLSACELSGNRADNGGAIYNDDGVLTIDGSTFSGNQAEDTPGGGAIDNDNGGEVTLTRSTLSGNTSASGGGAIKNEGTLTILACTLSGNTAAVGGGAIEHVAGVLTLTSSTLANNSAQWGGAIDGDGSSTIRLYSATLSRNHAGDKGGGIEETTGTLLMENSIVAGNTATNSGPDLKVSSINTQLGVNLISSTNGLGGSFAGIIGAPGLSALGSFGGPTETMVPLTASPAIDAGGPTTQTVDQRGLPRLDGRWVDIGAVEVQNYLLVTTANDSGAGSLRRIIELARAGSLIPFAPYLDGATIHLTSGPLVIAKNLDIDASGLPRGVTFTGTAVRAFDVAAGTQVTMKKLAVSGFESPDDDGAAILNAGQLALTDCDFSHNTGNEGGAIHNAAGGQLLVTACTLYDNEAQGDGGGLFNAGSATLAGSFAVGNGTSGNGAGIYNEGVLGMTDCSLSFNSSNTVGGGLDNVGTATVSRCTFSDNISEAGFGGGIANSAALILTNSTVSGNVSWIDNIGAGIGNSGSLVAESCTVSANDGGGISNTAGGSLTLANSIVAENTGSPDGPDVHGAINTQLGVNLLGTTTGVTNAFTGIVGDPMLQPLGVHGGPTLVMPPATGSPAIDAGGATSLATDQRGFGRVLGGTVDIGAVESGNAIPTVVVNTTADENNGMGLGNVSLRDAMTDAPAGAIIQFAPALDSQVITLTGGQLTAGKNLIVDASSLAGGLMLTAELVRGIEVAPGRGLAVSGLTMADFVGDGDVEFLDGAAIRNSAGYLELTGCLLEDNWGDDGGAIYNGGILRMESCTVANNESYGYGGGLFNAGHARLTRCNLVGNGSFQRAAGIYNQYRLALSECTLSGGGANFDGGGLVNHFAATAEIDRCTISGNLAEGGYGGGISNAGWLSLTNSTVSGNDAMDGEGGGGIGNSGSLWLVSSTITANFTTDSGGGILTSPAGRLTLENSIIAGNTADGSGPDIDGEIWSEDGVSLLGSLSGVEGTFTGIVAAPLLGPLADNGGPTATHLPQPGSPAINAGGSTGLTVDQRGFTRVLGGTVDIGAVESGVLFADDFSGPSPLSKYILENPSPGGGHSPMTIGVNSGELTFDYLGGFGVVGVNLAQKHPFLSTALECDIRFESPLGFDSRSSGGIAWMNGSSANGYLAIGLQLDEDLVYIFAYDGSVSTLAAGSLVLDRGVNYRTRLEVEAPGLIKAYVNDLLVTSLSFDVSLLPPLMNPNMGGNAQNTLRIVHDNFLVRRLD